MAAVKNIFEHGPITFPVSTSVTGGQLVEPNGAGTAVVPAAADSQAVLGVAMLDAEPNTDGATGTTAYGATVVDASWPRTNVAVAYRGAFKLTASGALSFGALVKAGANGAVVAAVVGTDPTEAIIGRCVEVGGIADGERGLILLGGVGAA